MTNQFKKRYVSHDRCSAHKDDSITDDSHFSQFLGQVNSGGTLRVYRQGHDVYNLGGILGMLQTEGTHITIVAQPAESGEHNAE